MDQIIDIATDGRHLSRDRGFLKLSQESAEIGRTPLDQVTGVIVHAHGTTWSTALLTALADHGAPVVLCGSNHVPHSILLPLEGNHAQGGRIRAQWQATVPMLKQAWKLIVVAKIKMQAAALESIGEAPTTLSMMARRVASGDSRNVEAQAARYYWPLMMGRQFRRNIDSKDVNSLLNYGYTILRTATVRAVVAAGLHPSIGLHHSNQSNAFALAYDLMEPFRPLVDCTARSIAHSRGSDVDNEAKTSLARLIATDVPLGESITPVSLALMKLASSLGQSFENRELALKLPEPPNALTLANLGQ